MEEDLLRLHRETHSDELRPGGGWDYNYLIERVWL